MTTGNKMVDQMEQISITGDIVCPNWFKWITKKTDKGKEKTDLLAINILANIVYWYRPAIDRDEKTDEIVAKRKKFRADLLQKQYADYAALFGQPISSVKTSMDLLEEMGLIKRHLNDITLDNGKILNNRMFIEIFPKKIKEITFNDPPQKNSPTLPKKFGGGSPKKIGESPQKNSGNTKNSPETSSKISNTTTSKAEPKNVVVDEASRAIFSSIGTELTDKEISDILQDANGNLTRCKSAVSFINNYKGNIGNIPGLIRGFLRGNYKSIPRKAVSKSNNQGSSPHSSYNWKYMEWLAAHEKEDDETFAKSAEQILGYQIDESIRYNSVKVEQLVEAKFKELENNPSFS